MPPSHHTSGQEAHLDLLFRIGSKLLGALLIGFIAACVTMLSLPCAWFGSNFEGQCGYGVMGTSVLVGLITFILAFALLLWQASRSRHNPAPSEKRAEATWLYKTWGALLALLYLAPILLDWIFAPIPITWAIQPLLFAAFMTCSARLAPHRDRHPAVSFFTLIPIVGPLIVGALLIRQRPSTPRDT